MDLTIDINTPQPIQTEAGTGIAYNPVTDVQKNGSSVVVGGVANVVVPTKTSDLINDSAFYSKPETGVPESDLSADVQTKLNKQGTITDVKVDGTSVVTGGVAAIDLTGKVDKETGKSLMSSAEHTKLEGISSGAEVNVQSDWNENDSTKDSFIKNKPIIPSEKTNLSEFVDDLGSSPVHTHSQYLTEHQSLSAYRTSSDQDTIDNALDSRIDTIEGVIPSQASSSNKLADKDFVNSSIATETAHYISNEGQPFSSLAQLEAYTGTVTNNDYAFVTGVDEQGNTYYDRYKATATTSVTWAKEYRLNNSSFTAQQWSAISSGITSVLVSSYNTHISDTAIHVGNGEKATWNAKYSKPNTGIPKTDLADAVVKDINRFYVITEDDVTVVRDSTKGVAPYNPSYGHTNITINTLTEADLFEGLTIMPIINSTMVVSSTYKNVRIRCGNEGTWYPVTKASTILAGSSFFLKADTRTYTFKHTNIPTGAWEIATEDDTTYTPTTLGFGYATCSTAEATTDKVAILSTYVIKTGATVSVKFNNAVPSGSTLNINTKGAKAIFYNGSAITNGIIKAGDIANFIYDGTNYVLLSVDTEITGKEDTSNKKTSLDNADNNGYPTTLAVKTVTDTMQSLINNLATTVSEFGLSVVGGKLSITYEI